MIDLDFTFEAELWNAPGDSWHFVTVPENISADIKAFTKHNYKGFGSVRVKVKTGDTEWLTSLFPDKKTGCYFLPLKATVRKSEKLSVGDNAHVSLSVLI